MLQIKIFYPDAPKDVLDKILEVPNVKNVDIKGDHIIVETKGTVFLDTVQKIQKVTEAYPWLVMIETLKDDICCEPNLQEMIDDYGVEAVSRGYVVSRHGDGFDYLERLDCLEKFETDTQAAKQARVDGYKLYQLPDDRFLVVEKPSDKQGQSKEDSETEAIKSIVLQQKLYNVFNGYNLTRYAKDYTINIIKNNAFTIAQALEIYLDNSL